MTPDTYSVAIERGPVPDGGEPCPNCDDATNLVEAVVTYITHDEPEYGGGRSTTDAEVCGDCVWHVIRGRHEPDDAAHLLLHPGAPIPPGVRDPLHPTP